MVSYLLSSRIFPLSGCLFFEAVVRGRLCEGRKGAFDLLIGHTVGYPHIAGASEGGSGNHQDIVFLTILTEFLFIGLRRLYEKIKCALGLNTLKSQILKPVVEQVPVPVIRLQIHLGIQAAHDDSLHQGRGIDTAQHPVRDGGRIEHFPAVL